MDPDLLALALHCVTETFWSSSAGDNDFLSYDLATVRYKTPWLKELLW